MKVGFLVVSYTKALDAMGATQSSAEPPADYYAKEWVDIVNKTGGLAGRRIDPVYYTVDATAPDWTTEMQAGCQQFAVDSKVAMVMEEGTQGVDLAQCLLKYGIVDIDAFGTTIDSANLRQTPNLFMPSFPRIDRYVAGMLDTMAATGWLTSHDKLGVLAAACPEDQRTYDNVVAPRAKKVGFALDRVEFNCPTGFDNVKDYGQGSQSAVLRFRTDGVTKVMFLTPVANLALVLFSQDAESQHYHPGYVLDSTAILNDDGSNVPDAQKKNMKGAGWSPVLEFQGDAAQMPTSPARKHCDSLATTHGHQVPTNGDTTAFYLSCDGLMLMRQGLTASRGATNFSTLVAAIESLGASYVGAADFGATRFGSGRHDGPAAIRPYAWDSATGHTVYTGPTRNLP